MVGGSERFVLKVTVSWKLGAFIVNALRRMLSESNTTSVTEGGREWNSVKQRDWLQKAQHLQSTTALLAHSTTAQFAPCTVPLLA